MRAQSSKRWQSIERSTNIESILRRGFPCSIDRSSLAAGSQTLIFGFFRWALASNCWRIVYKKISRATIGVVRIRHGCCRNPRSGLLMSVRGMIDVSLVIGSASLPTDWPRPAAGIAIIARFAAAAIAHKIATCIGNDSNAKHQHPSEATVHKTHPLHKTGTHLLPSVSNHIQCRDR